jgi:hypothetical protein
MKKILFITVIASLVPLSSYSEDNSPTDNDAVNKNVTIIKSQSTADGKSELNERILEECIVSLPKVDQLEPEITSDSKYLKEINGDPSKNEFVKMYTASLEINYMIYQKVLVVVTTNSIQAKEPVMKVMEKNLKQSKSFVSNSSEGDLYAGQSHRQYYFSSPEAASNDVKKRAAAWLKEQSAVICQQK